MDFSTFTKSHLCDQSEILEKLFIAALNFLDFNFGKLVLTLLLYKSLIVRVILLTLNILSSPRVPELMIFVI